MEWSGLEGADFNAVCRRAEVSVGEVEADTDAAPNSKSGKQRPTGRDAVERV